jgi:hypothetical protein
MDERVAGMTEAEVRALALELPEAVEQDHHGRPSFRVRGRIFATLWTPRALNVMVGPDRILSAEAQAPGVCSRVMWGQRLSAVRVDLDAADAEFVRGLLAEAWSVKAPRGLL